MLNKPIGFIDFEMLSLAGQYYPIQFGMAKLEPGGVPEQIKDIILPVEGLSKKHDYSLLNFMKARGLEASFMESQLSRSDNEIFKSLVERVQELSKSGADVLSTQETVLEHFFEEADKLAKSKGVLMSHTRIDLNVITQMLNKLHAEGRVSTILDKYFKGGQSVVDGLVFANNKFQFTRYKRFINRKKLLYNFEDFQEAFKEIFDYVQDATIQGRVPVVDTSEMAAYVVGMAEEAGYMRSITSTPYYGTSIETLLSGLKKASEEFKAPLKHRDLFLMPETHTAALDAMQSSAIAEVIMDVGKKMMDGEQLTKHDLSILRGLDSARMERAYAEIAEKTSDWAVNAYVRAQKLGVPFRDLAVEIEPIRQQLIDRYGAPYSGIIDGIISDVLKDTAQGIGKEELVGNVLNKARVRFQEGNLPLPSQAQLKDWRAHFCSTASTSEEIAAARAAAHAGEAAVARGASAGAVGVMEKSGSMLKRMASRVEKFWQTKLGKMTFAGVGFWMLFKTITALQTPSFKDLMMRGDLTDDDDIYIPRTMYWDPTRIITTTGMGGVQASMMAGFGSPMRDVLRRAIEVVDYFPKKESVRIARAMHDMPFIQGNIRWAGLESAAQAESEVILNISGATAPETSVIFNRIGNITKHNSLPEYAVRPHKMRDVISVVEPDAESMVRSEYLKNESILLSMTDGSQIFREAYLERIGFYTNNRFKAVEVLSKNRGAAFYSGINTKTITDLNTWYDPAKKHYVGFLSDFSSPAPREPMERASFYFIKQLMEGYNAKVRLDYTAADYSSLRSFLGGDHYNATQRQKVMDGVMWFHNPRINRGVLVSEYIDPITAWKAEYRDHLGRLASMVYQSRNGSIRLRPLDHRDLTMSKYNYTERVRVPVRMANRGRVETSY